MCISAGSLHVQSLGSGRPYYNMFEKINEPVEVLVKFGHRKIEPTHFRWRQKTYEINKINLVHKQRQGNDRVYYFSVSDNANFFRLAFFTGDLSWKLEELYYEG